MAKLLHLKPEFRQVIDPHDQKSRPFCSTIGAMIRISFAQNRYLRPTPEEDRIWRESGQRLIEETERKKAGRPTASLG